MKKKKLATLLITTLLLVNESAVALAEVNESINEVEESIILDDQNSDIESSEDCDLVIENFTQENSSEEVKDDLEDNTASEENTNSYLNEETVQDENLSYEEDKNVISEEDIVKDETNEIETNIDNIESYKNENSTKGTAKNILLNVSNTFSIKEAYEEMWAKFTLPSDGYITINLDKVLMGQSQEKRINLILENESGKQVYLNTDSEYGGDDGATVNKWTIGLASGTYYLNLQSAFYINLGQYDLKYKVDYVKDSNFEKEKNDTIYTANVIELNKTYKGIMNEEGGSWTYDQGDYYAVDIKNSNFALKVKHSIDSEYIYYIYDSYGNTVDYIYENEMEYEDGGIYKYTFKNLVSGRYYIKLDSYGSVEKDPYEITINEAKNGWVTEGGKTYYYDLGKKVIGLAAIDGQTYYFDNSGVMKTGWISTTGNWYYFNPNTGAMHKGWLKLGASWYYLDSISGIMVTGSVYIGDDLYCFNNDGVMQSSKWYNDYGTWYYLKSSGAAYKGWLKEGGQWYYLDDYYGYMVTGATNVRGVMYLFNESGAMNTSSGWRKIYGSYYYANSNGTLKTGWLKDSGNWYYLDSYGMMVTYSYRVNGVTYYFGNDGAMRTGWQYLYANNFYSNYYFYFGNDGAMRTGWHTINGVTYYFIENSNDAPTGSMATGWWRIYGVWYYFDSNGEFIY